MPIREIVNIFTFLLEGAGKKKTYQVLSLEPPAYVGTQRTNITAV